ncbi:NAD(P)H-hydrate epimerase [Lacisediminihabitans profunda]|uniref:NAD(P)H-hydrate epimerase n=1 Tax=Lacisediminihabitans profunda TaxID=2594790 RepID=A0A5C8UP97_9MICO|nr:NAD(P)H-hydrate epimerase [Lacisediminihabitans profunda]TXN29711.1 NAD(P)H-hydrate epimerase [Lacisediminihabitans profunda]
MIRGYSAQQMRDAEAPHLAAGEPLMQRAAAGLAAEVRGALPADGGRVLLLVGTGNNGADTLYAGAELAAGGADVAIVMTGPRAQEQALASALAAGARVVPLGETARAAAAADVVVDGILGTGTSANPALRGDARTVVEAVQGVTPRPFVVAVDIPSGINPDDGSVPDPLVLPADLTVTFGGYKAGLLLQPAAGLAGRVRVIDIGLGPDLDALRPTVTLPD